MALVDKAMQGASAATTVGTSDYVMGLSCWMLCSVGMMVFNSRAARAFRPSCTLVGFQMVFTICMLLVCGWGTIRIGSRWDALRWMMVAPLFMGLLLTSVLALQTAPMTLVITFRALSPLCAMLVERFFYPTPLKVSGPMLLFLALMICGCMVYTIGLDWRKGVTGIEWALLNNFLAVGDRLMQRYMLAKDQSPVDISKSGCTLLNNLFGLLPLAIAALCLQEYREVPQAIAALDAWGYTWVLLSCVVGCCISYTGVWVQSLISATSFMVLVNANKFLIIFLEVLVMKEKDITYVQVLAASITVMASVGFGKAKACAEEEADNALKECLSWRALRTSKYQCANLEETTDKDPTADAQQEGKELSPNDELIAPGKR